MLACFFIAKTMKKKKCGECKWLKFVDAEGDGWCEQWEESDVNVSDEACCEFEEREENESDYE